MPNKNQFDLNKLNNEEIDDSFDIEINIDDIEFEKSIQINFTGDFENHSESIEENTIKTIVENNNNSKETVKTIDTNIRKRVMSKKKILFLILTILLMCGMITTFIIGFLVKKEVLAHILKIGSALLFVILFIALIKILTFDEEFYEKILYYKSKYGDLNGDGKYDELDRQIYEEKMSIINNGEYVDENTPFIKCPYCGFDNSLKRKKCRECGGSLKK